MEIIIAEVHIFTTVGAKNKVGRNSDGKGFFLDVKVNDDLLGESMRLIENC